MQARWEMRGYNTKLCRTHFVGDIEYWKPGCYTLICHRCAFTEGIGSWYGEMWKDKSGRYVWSKKQWPYVFMAMQLLEEGRSSRRHQNWPGRDQVIKEVKEHWHKWIEENIK